jgi:hypothetical protein
MSERDDAPEDGDAGQLDYFFNGRCSMCRGMYKKNAQVTNWLRGEKMILECRFRPLVQSPSC